MFVLIQPLVALGLAAVTWGVYWLLISVLGLLDSGNNLRLGAPGPLLVVWSALAPLVEFWGVVTRGYPIPVHYLPAPVYLLAGLEIRTEFLGPHPLSLAVFVLLAITDPPKSKHRPRWLFVVIATVAVVIAHGGWAIRGMAIVAG